MKSLIVSDFQTIKLSKSLRNDLSFSYLPPLAPRPVASEAGAPAPPKVTIRSYGRGECTGFFELKPAKLWLKNEVVKRWWLLWNRSGPVGFRKSKIAHYRSGLPHPHGPRRNHLQLPPASGARRPRWSPLGASRRPADCQGDHQYQPDAVETVGDGCDIWWFLTHLQPFSKAKSWKASRA